ncbi:hypothetical protein GCM10023094_26230 [Rhodococcus olei]|uniref:DUF1109 domain-containing protein n=1 Tax=Rhodococcus olei TaxID=2161675 RepID=A0ABP8P4K4_9NOCA
MTSTAPAPAAPPDRRAATPPGPVVLTVVVLAVAALVVLVSDWWPGSRNTTDFDRLFFGGVAVLVLLVTGLVWAIKALYVLGRDRTWSWWIAAAPAVVVAGAAVAAVLPIPDFESARPEFDGYVRALPDDPAYRAEGVRLGGIEIAHVHRGPDGGVYFQDDDGTFLSVSSGWVYSPDRAPVGRDDFTATPLGDGWYSYTEVWRD